MGIQVAFPHFLSLFSKESSPNCTKFSHENIWTAGDNHLWYVGLRNQ